MNIKNTVNTMSYLENLTQEKFSISNFIKNIRESEEMSQVDFAKRLGVT